jgi:PAS domain S-box-containing protein
LKYCRLQDSARDGVIILDGDDGKIIDANKFILELLDYSLDDIIGLYLWELGFIQDKNLALKAFIDLKLNGYVHYCNISMEANDGRRIIIDLIGNAFLFGKEKIFQCNIIDITEREMMAGKLLKSNEQFQTFFKYSPEGIIIMDLSGKIEESNNNICSMLDYTNEELLKLNLVDIIFRSSIEKSLKKLKTIQEYSSIAFETGLSKRNGERLPIIMQVIALPDHKSIAFCTDISERKHLEEKMRLANTRFDLLSRTIELDIRNQMIELKKNLTLLVEEHSDNSSNEHIRRAIIAVEQVLSMIEVAKTDEQIDENRPIMQDKSSMVKSEKRTYFKELSS